MSSRRPRIKATPNLFAGRAKARGDVKVQPNTNNSPRSSVNKPVLPAAKKSVSSAENSTRVQSINQNIENLQPSLVSKESHINKALKDITHADKTSEKVNHVSLNENNAIEKPGIEAAKGESTEVFSLTGNVLAVNDKVIENLGGFKDETINIITDKIESIPNIITDKSVEETTNEITENYVVETTNAITDKCKEDTTNLITDKCIEETTNIITEKCFEETTNIITDKSIGETINEITDKCKEETVVVIDQVIQNLDKSSEEVLNSYSTNNVKISDISIEDTPFIIDDGIENLDEISKVDLTNIISTTVTIENPINSPQAEFCNEVNSDATKLANDNNESEKVGESIELIQDFIQETNESENSNETTKVSKLSTGQFVNGRYLPKENDSIKHEKSGNAKPVLKRILGAKNKFKPNLFTRSKQMEVELKRGQIQKLASLPEVNNPTRSRKYSSGDDSSRRRRHSSLSSAGADSGDEKSISPKSGSKVEPRARKISTGDPVTTTSPDNNSPGQNKANSSPVSQLISQEAQESSVDSPDEIVVKEVSDVKDSSKSATAKALIQRKHIDHLSTENGKKRRRRSWSGSNSSGDELFKAKNNSDRLTTKPRRKTADSKFPVADRTNYALKLRKIESKRRFSNGVPNKGTMTMFDLIYYNPDNGTAMKEDEKQDLSSQPTSPVKPMEPVEEEPDLEQEDDSALPVPQVKVGVDGEIIIDESSTMVETTASKRAKTDLMDSTLVVENSNKLTNYGTYSKKRKYNDWGERETFRFYRALSIVGSDFSMMESLFKHRNRHELKLKFKKEERTNGALIDKCLRQRGQFSDLKQFMQEESEDEIVSEEKVDKPGRGRRRMPGTASKVSKKGEARGRKRTSRGLYESSSGGEEGDVSETSRSPAARVKHSKNNNTTSTKHKTPSRQPDSVPAVRSNEVDESVTSGPGIQIDTTALHKIPGVNFPPGLLAANPGLAGAKPGSLVVVASPSKTDPSSQLLHVYMVSDKKNKSSRDGTPPVSRSPTPTRRGGDQNGGFSIDPAVVRAVDRKRTSVEPGGGLSVDKARRMEEEGQIFRRQRTLSEGSTISPSRLKSLGTADPRNEPFGSEPFSRTRRSRLASLSEQPDQHFEISGNSCDSIAPLDTSTAVEMDATATSTQQQLPIARKSRPVIDIE